jgi:hypothetical protein
MVMTVTRPQEVAAQSSRAFSLPTAAGTVEIKFQTGNTAADQAPCQIIILQPEAVSAQSSEYTTTSSGFGFTDEEPTWEDAAWQ